MAATEDSTPQPIWQVNQDSQFWLVWNPRSGNARQKHYSYDTAEKEAKRLAKVKPGCHFYVLECLGFAMQGQPTFTPAQAAKAAARIESGAVTRDDSQTLPQSSRTPQRQSGDGDGQNTPVTRGPRLMKHKAAG